MAPQQINAISKLGLLITSLVTNNTTAQQQQLLSNDDGSSLQCEVNSPTFQKVRDLWNDKIKAEMTGNLPENIRTSKLNNKDKLLFDKKTYDETRGIWVEKIQESRIASSNNINKRKPFIPKTVVRDAAASIYGQRFYSMHFIRPEFSDLKKYAPAAYKHYTELSNVAPVSQKTLNRVQNEFDLKLHDEKFINCPLVGASILGAESRKHNNNKHSFTFSQKHPSHFIVPAVQKVELSHPNTYKFLTTLHGSSPHTTRINRKLVANTKKEVSEISTFDPSHQYTLDARRALIMTNQSKHLPPQSQIARGERRLIV
jgi:hypothetical protein